MAGMNPDSPLVKRYAKGVRFEHKVITDLESRGYETLRAAGSKGRTKIDVLALKPGGPVLMIQCKSDGKISKMEWDTIYKVSGWVPSAVAVVALNGPKGRGVTYMALTGEKIHYGREQPAHEITP